MKESSAFDFPRFYIDTTIFYKMRDSRIARIKSTENPKGPNVDADRPVHLR